MTGDVPAGEREMHDVLYCTNTGLCVAYRHATIAPWLIGSVASLWMTTIQRCNVPPGTAERVDDAPQADRGLLVPSSLPYQSTAELGPLPNDPQGDASRCTVCTERFPACSRLTWAADVLAGAHATWQHEMETIHDRGDRHVAHKGRGIFLVDVDIDAQHDKEFNEWYNTEHLPELLAVPGILAAARYVALKGGPKYLACYELDNVAVMRTPAFTNRPRTPWGERVSPSVIGTNLTRIVGEQIYPDGIDMPERGMAPVLQIGRMSVPTAVEAEWNAWYNNEYIPGYRKVPGVMYARRYRVHEGTSGYTTVYEFESTAVPESAEWKEQQQHSSPNSPRMRQAMTHAPGSAGVYTRIDP